MYIVISIAANGEAPVTGSISGYAYSVCFSYFDCQESNEVIINKRLLSQLSRNWARRGGGRGLIYLGCSARAKPV